MQAFLVHIDLSDRRAGIAGQQLSLGASTSRLEAKFTHRVGNCKQIPVFPVLPFCFFAAL
jgi:hypothetical protein